MKNAKKLLALLLAVLMCVGILAACGEQPAAPAATEDTKAAEPEAAEPAVEETSADTPLVVGYSPFNSKFSPFFAETAYDQDAQAITQLALLNTDRVGAVVEKGISVEPIDYNGTPYTYEGPADLTITENDDGTVYYDFVLRDNLVFSDGEPLTIDDVIFSMYVLSDPTYDGSSTFFALPIEGMDAYRTGMDTLFNLLVAAGPDNDDFTLWDEDTQTAFWADLNQAGAAFAQEIVDTCVAYGIAADSDDVYNGAAGWGFDVPEDATVEDFFTVMCEAYEWDLASMNTTESAGSSLFDLMDDYNAYTTGIETGESAANISGIQKIDDYNLRVVLTKVDAAAIYQFTLAIAPLHYYGDPELYDYDNDSFGFPKGDLSTVRAKTTEPLGAGPYKFLKFENGVIYYEANENYFLGEPQTKFVNFLQCTTDDDKLNGVTTGTIDITDPSMNTDTADAIKAANGNDDLVGDVIATDLVNNLGYGYIGISANVVNVNDEPASDASKNLRRALATILAVYRDVAVDSYYGELASVINYPISDTSWAAPRPADDGYQVAFSVDVNGEPIYTSDMSAEDKYAAALEASLGFFEAAGYTVEDGKVVEAPEGAPMEFTFWIPADGTGDHPSFMILTETKKALETIGIEFIIKDLSNSSELWTAIESEECGMWCAAWGATPDPDMYQIYYSGSDALPAGGSNYMYDIDDEELNELILDARNSTDQTYRKAMYKACLDIVIDWAVEIPVYQRQNAIIFSAERVNLDTVTPDITTYYTWLNEIQNIELN